MAGSCGPCIPPYPRIEVGLSVNSTWQRPFLAQEDFELYEEWMCGCSCTAPFRFPKAALSTSLLLDETLGGGFPTRGWMLMDPGGSQDCRVDVGQPSWDNPCLSPQPIQPSLNQPTDLSTGVANCDAQQTTYHIHEHFTTLYVLASPTPLLFSLLLLLLLLPIAVAFRH